MAEHEEANAGTHRYAFVVALRGLAAAWVVLFHARAGHHVDELALALPRVVDIAVARGDLGVSIFFVLSGFVMSHSIGKHEVTWAYAMRSLLRRWARLSPPYWISIGFVVALAAVSARFVPGKSFTFPSAARLVLHLFYLQDLFGVAPLDTVYWTLCVELQFYVVFYLMARAVSWLTRKVGEPTAYAAVFLPLLSLSDARNARFFGDRWHGLFLDHFSLFLLGALVWKVGVGATSRRSARALLFGHALVLAIISLMYWGPTLAVGIATAGVLLSACRSERVRAILSLRPLLALGAISYSFYLIHNPITGAVFRVGYALTGHSLATEALWLGATLTACLVASYALYVVVERPSIEWSRRISRDAQR